VQRASTRRTTGAPGQSASDSSRPRGPGAAATAPRGGPGQGQGSWLVTECPRWAAPPWPKGIRTPGAAACRSRRCCNLAGHLQQGRRRPGRDEHTVTHTRRRHRSLPALDAAPARACRRAGPVRPGHEHDACGVAFVADIAGRVTHGIVEQGLTALRNLDHRGASGSEPDTGDGAGILVQVPDAFLRAVLHDELQVELPPVGGYAVGTAFLAQDEAEAGAARAAIDGLAAEEGLRTLVWRELPVDPSGAASEPPRCRSCRASPSWCWSRSTRR
jgi:hypothetical protein